MAATASTDGRRASQGGTNWWLEEGGIFGILLTGRVDPQAKERGYVKGNSGLRGELRGNSKRKSALQENTVVGEERG